MPFEIPSELMVSVSGVRGRVGAGLAPEVVSAFASAFGALLREGSDRPRVVIARDSRTSGPMFVRAATAALQSVGCDVIDVGLAPTPSALLAVRSNAADGGIVVTASHNPVEWNALKFASRSGMFLDGDEGARMRAYLTTREPPRAGWDGLGGVRTDATAVERHIAAVLELPYLDRAALRQRRFRVALDCVRGAGAVLLPRLLRELGCAVIGINLEPDGRFPRPPEPVAANLHDLERLVRETGSDIGLATDPDGDRLSLVDERGRAIGEDYTLALAARLVLGHRQGPVVTNLSTSRVVENVAAEFGVPFVRAPVGEINVARRMQAAGAVVGGEGNGGVILPDVHLTRDAAIAAALVLQLLVETGAPVSQLVARHRPYVIVKDKVPRPASAVGADAGGVAGGLEQAYRLLESRLGAPAADRQDGLRLEWPEDRRWLHVRPSGTEPILRMIAEAPTRQAARALVDAAHQALGVEERTAGSARD